MVLEFNTISSSTMDARIGAFTDDKGRKLETPCYFPMMEIFTGPPGPEPKLPGEEWDIFRNGGFWKLFKKISFHEQHIPAFLTSVLHFIDFSLSPKALDEWLNVNLAERIRRASGIGDYEPVIFLDSGGFKFMYESGFNIDDWGIKANPKSIYEFQRKIGGDIFASLDIPLAPELPEREVYRRMRISIKNAVKSLEICSGDEFLYLAVHGRNGNETAWYVRELTRRIQQRKLTKKNFGFAIGSLVPIADRPGLLVDVIFGAVQEIKNTAILDWKRIPIHAFGISSNLIPALVAIGIDTFDGSSFMKMSRNLNYAIPLPNSKPGLLYKDIRGDDFDAFPCDCYACRQLNQGGLKRVLEIMSSSDKKHTFIPGKEPIIKSNIYSLLGYHNLQRTFQLMDFTTKNIKNGMILENIKLSSTLTKSGRKLLEELNFKYENFVHEWMSYCQANSPLFTGTEAPAINAEPKITPREILDRSWKPKPVGRAPPQEEFEISNRNYTPKGSSIALILACSKKKPYANSTTHKIIMNYLNSANVPLERIEKITLSGKFGPVPLAYEEEPQVVGYDDQLHKTNKKQIEKISKKLQIFLEEHRESFTSIIAFVNNPTYRIPVNRAFKRFGGRAILLPEKSSLRPRKDDLELLVEEIMKVEES